MKSHRKTLVFVIIVIVVIQFIQPTKNTSLRQPDSDISDVYSIPVRIRSTLTDKCYDCHSNHTKYPWYVHIQPIGWWFAASIYEGKQRLNFSEFKNYQAEKALRQLESIREIVRERAMPVSGLVLMHPYREMTEDDEKAVHDWIETVIATEN